MDPETTSLNVSGTHGCCHAITCDGCEKSRERTACRESNAKAANADASQPSDFRGILQSRWLPTLGGTVPRNWRLKAI
jgi:hypothetical protein